MPRCVEHTNMKACQFQFLFILQVDIRMKNMMLSCHMAKIPILVLQGFFFCHICINRDGKFCRKICGPCGMIEMSVGQKNRNRCAFFLSDTVRQLLWTGTRIDHNKLLCLIIDCKIAVGLHRSYYILIYF